MHPKKNHRYTTQLNANHTEPGAHCDYLSFQTWNVHKCVSK